MRCRRRSSDGLRELHLQRDRLRGVVRYRRMFLESLLAHGEEEAEQVRGEFRQAEARNERDYEEASSAMAAKKELSPAVAAEIAAKGLSFSCE